MSLKSTNLLLSLLSSHQAQKHITVNDSLLRLDGLVQLVIQSITVTDPPTNPIDTQLWAVPTTGASSAWAGQGGYLALWQDGAWQFIQPRTGWRGWVADQGGCALFTGSDWQLQPFFPASALASTATAGSATLPNAPSAFLPVQIDGQDYKLPLYDM